MEIDVYTLVRPFLRYCSRLDSSSVSSLSAVFGSFRQNPEKETKARKKWQPTRRKTCHKLLFEILHKLTVIKIKWPQNHLSTCISMQKRNFLHYVTQNCFSLFKQKQHWLQTPKRQSLCWYQFASFNIQLTKDNRRTGSQNWEYNNNYTELQVVRMHKIISSYVMNICLCCFITYWYISNSIIEKKKIINFFSPDHCPSS